MCEIDIDGYVDVWRETKRKARKEHRCSCCHSVIRCGEEYIDHFDVFEGMVNRSKLCMLCDVDRQAFARAHGGILPNPAGFDHDLEQCVEEDEWYDEQPGGSNWNAVLQRLTARRLAAECAYG
jgi:hypothetical protein